jgi:hypothetical protein
MDAARGGADTRDMPGKPGADAWGRYRKGLRRWRRPVVPRLVYAYLPLTALMLALVVWTGGRVWLFASGLLIGSLATLVVRARARSAVAESATGKVLAALAREGWQVEHDLPHERGNIDHVALGPGGLFLVETKSLRGQVVVENGVLTTRAREDGALIWRGKHLPGWLRSRAASVAEQVRKGGGMRPWVHPVLVIWGDFAQRRVEAGGLVYIHGDELADWLRSRPKLAA